MDKFTDTLSLFIENYCEEYPDTSMEEVIAALEAKAIAMRQEIAAVGFPGAN